MDIQIDFQTKAGKDRKITESLKEILNIYLNKNFIKY